MNQEQTYNNCENYNTPECPHINDELMKTFVADVHIFDEKGNKPFSTTEEINKSFCNACNSFKDERTGKI